MLVGEILAGIYLALVVAPNHIGMPTWSTTVGLPFIEQVSIGSSAARSVSLSSTCGVLALCSGDTAFRDHVAARLSDPDRSPARTRLM